MADEIVKAETRDLSLFGQTTTYCSLDLSTDRGKELLMKARVLTNTLLGEKLNIPIDVTDVVAYETESVNEETGEVGPWLCIVLICADGSTYYTGSKGVKKSIPFLFLLRGQPPWNPPYKLVLKNQPQKNGHQWWVLQPVDCESNASKHSKK